MQDDARLRDLARPDAAEEGAFATISGDAGYSLGARRLVEMMEGGDRGYDVADFKARRFR